MVFMFFIIFLFSEWESKCGRFHIPLHEQCWKILTRPSSWLSQFNFRTRGTSDSRQSGSFHVYMETKSMHGSCKVIMGHGEGSHVWYRPQWQKSHLGWESWNTLVLLETKVPRTFTDYVGHVQNTIQSGNFLFLDHFSYSFRKFQFIFLEEG